MLTSFNGKSITYDSNGCVKSYDGWTYTWNNGKLKTISKSTVNSGGIAPKAFIGGTSQNYTFTYNGQGQRIQKKYTYFPGSIQQIDYMTSCTSDYVYDLQGRLISDIRTLKFSDGTTITKKFVFLYDEAEIIGVIFTNSGGTETYYYDKNLRGDVIGILDSSGNVVVEYKYDAYGNCTCGYTANNDLADSNPIRYRSYYYDEDTGLYYLNARYYNPEWRRFISPDDTAYLDPESANGLNLYCYCNNDPVNYVDPSGHAWETIFDIGFASWSLYEYFNDPSWQNLGWFALDFAALLIPFIPGGGKVVTKVDDIPDLYRFVKDNSKVIVLGQSMKLRIEPFAKEICATIYEGVSNFAALKKSYGVVISDILGYLDNMAFIVKESLIEGARFIDYGFDPNKTLKGLKGIDLFEGIMSKITIYSEKMFAQLFQKKNVYRYFRDKLFR